MGSIKSFSQLKAAGGIISREPIKKTLTWTHKNDAGEEVSDSFEVYIVKQSFGSLADLYKETSREQLAVAISKALLLENDKGKLELMKYDDAYQLDPSLAHVILDGIREVNGGEAKNSQPPTNSSVNSSSPESVAAP